MSIKEIGVDIGEGTIFPVKLAYQISSLEDLESLLRRADFHYCSVGIVFQRKKKVRAVFGSARRHEEFKQAVEKDIGKVDEWYYGQLFTKSRSDRLTINRLILNASPGKNEATCKESLSSVLEAIDSKFLHSTVIVRYENENQYLFNPINKNFIRTGGI